jgi:hypothetical protein
MIFHATPILQIAYDIKEELRQIYEKLARLVGELEK